jgi:hypothetical protein
MPFTFCHPAAVLPFNYLPKKWISLSGLMAGSIAPDFEYFIRMRKTSVYSHSLAGLAWFDIPVAILLTFIYFEIVRKPLTENLPVVLKRRVHLFSKFDWIIAFKHKWITILISVLVGALSHLIWDILTLVTIDYLKKFFSIDTPVSYYVFWSLHSLLGAVIIIFAFFQLPVDRNAQTSKSFATFWFVTIDIAVLVFITRTIIDHNLLIADYIVTAVAASLIGLVGTSLLFRYRILNPS